MKNIKDLIQKNLEETREILLKEKKEEAVEFSEWMKNKANIKFNKKIPNFLITNNYIYWCDLGNNIGNEQNKIRPVLVIKTKKNSNICTIIPLTSERVRDSRWYHIDLDNLESTLLIEQLRNVSKLRILSPMRLKGKLCKINQNDWTRINKAVQNYYKLNPLI